MYWKKQGRGIENWDFSIPFPYTALMYPDSIPPFCTQTSLMYPKIFKLWWVH